MKTVPETNHTPTGAPLFVTRDSILAYTVPDRRLLYASASFEPLYGCSAERYVTDSGARAAVVHPDDLDAVEDAQRVCLNDGFSELDHRIVLGDGQVRWLHVRTWVTRNEHGHAVRVDQHAEDVTRRRQADDAVRASEDQFQRFMRHLPGSVYVIDQQGRVLFCNARHAGMWGRTPEEVIGKTTRDYMPPQTVLEVGQENARVLREGRAIDVHFSVIENGAETRWLATKFPIPREGQPTVVGAVAIEITKEWQAETALRSREEQYRLLTENMADVVWMLDAQNGRFTYVSPSVEQLRGYTQEEVLQQSLDQVVTPESLAMIRDGLPARLAAFLNGDESARVKRHEVEQLRRDGTTVWTEVITRLLRDEAGALQILGVSRDISDRKRSETALRASEERLRDILHGIPDLMFRVSADFRFIDYSAPSDDDLLVPPSAFLGKRIDELFPPDLAKILLGAHEKAHSTREPVQIEYLLPDNGRHREFELRAIPLNDGTALSIVRDITERKRMDERVRRLNRMLTMLSRVNEAVARIRAVPALLETACQIAVEHGGLQMAWVGLLDPASGRFRPVASAGDARDYIAWLAADTADASRARSPIDLVLRTGQHVVISDIEHDPRLVLWRERAMQSGFRSAAAVPLRVAGETRGAITFFADQVGFFDEQETALLDDMADDLSFALEFAEQEAQRLQTEAALRTSEDQFQRFMRHLPGEVAVYDDQGRILFANEVCTAAWGNPPGGVVGRFVGDLLPPASLADVLSQNAQVLAEDRAQVFEYQQDDSQGTTHWLATRFPIPREGQSKAVGVISIEITRQVETEAALRSSEAQFQSFMRHLPGEVVIFEEDGRVLYANERTARGVGHSPDEVIGRSISEFRSPLVTGHIADQNAQVLAQNRVIDFMFRRVGEDGDTFWKVTKFPIPRDGKGPAIGAVALEVTAERQAEAALRASEAQFQSFMQHLPAAVWIVDEQDRYVYVNDFYEALTEVGSVSLIGRRLDECLSPVSAAAYAAENALVRASGHAIEFSGVRNRNGSEPTYWMVTKFPISRENQPPLIGCVGLDVTKVRRAEQVLQEAHDELERRVQERTGELERTMDRLEAIFSHSADGIALLHAETGIEQANTAFDRLFGAGAGTHAGRRLPSLFQPYYEHVIALAVAEVVRTHQTRQVEAEVLQANGTRRTVELSLSPINRAGSPVTHLVCILRDITERKQLEDALAEQFRELDRFFSISLDLMCIADQEGHFIKLNRAWEEVLNTPLADLQGRRYLDLVHPDDVDDTLARMRELSQKRPVFNFINRYRARDGSYRLLEWHATAFGDKVYAAARDVTERVRVEEELRASEQLYRTTLATMSEGLIVRGSDGAIQFCNEATERITGLTVAQLKHEASIDPAWRLIAEDGSGIDEPDRPSLSVLRSGIPLNNMIIGVVKPDQSLSWMLVSSEVLTDGQGHVQTSVTTLTDITRLKQIQAELQQKHTDELQMQAYLKALHQVTVDLNHVDTLDDFYRQTVELGKQHFGFERLGLVLYDSVSGGGAGTYGTDMSGQTVAEYDMVIPSAKVIEPIQRILHQRERFTLVERTTLYAREKMVGSGQQAVAALWDGEALGWLSADNAIHGQSISRAQTEVLALYAVTVGSLLARKRSEERRLALSHRLALATRAGGIGIWDWNLVTDDMFWDEGMARIYGIGPDDLENPVNRYARYVHPDDWPQVRDSLAAAGQSDIEHEIEFRIIHPSGDIRYIRSQAMLLRNEHGDPVRVIGVNLDQTRIKLAEQALRSALAKEKELGELKTRFVSMASHEFRTPLATIMATTETLAIYRSRMDEAQVDARLGKIRQQVTHLKDVMDDVLQLARMQAGRAVFNFAIDDLHALCLEIVEEFQSQTEYRDRLHYTGGGHPVLVRFDRTQMRHVISNLVHNALKYSAADRPVYVKLATDDRQRAWLTVKDEGIGISPGDLAHLYEPFHRGTNVGTISGTGLGLSIARQAIEAHRGTLNVESTVNEGTTFTLVLPKELALETDHA